MGLIRKSLFLGTGGLVAPNSRKQRLQMQQLAALPGGTQQEIRRRGGRNDIDRFLGIAPASARKSWRSLVNPTRSALRNTPELASP